MFTYFEDKNHKSTQKLENYKILTSILESVDTIVIIEATTTSITLSVSGVGLIVEPISDGVASVLSLGNKILHKIILNKNKKCKQNVKDQQTNQFFAKVC